MNAPGRRLRQDDSVADRTSLAGRLILLGTQMLKLADEVSARDPATGREDATSTGMSASTALLGLLAEEIYRDRRRRARHLPARMLGEPAWDILLDLYAAAARGEAVSVSNACLAADAPASTALRWLHHLQSDGLIERLADPTDARRHYVRLTEAGAARMTAYFAECRADLVGDLGAEAG